MKFKKILLIGVDEAKLGSTYWDRINALTDKKVYLPKDSPEIKINLKDADCLLVNFGITVTKADVDSAPNLKYIGILATAFGKVDVEYANNKGIVVCNLPGYSSESVAEFTIAAILETIRHLDEGKKRGRAGNVSEEGISAIEIKDRIFGIIGLGNIGTRVGEIASGFDARVKYWSRHKKDVKNVTYQELDDLISEADFLSLNLAQTPETERILDKKRFQLLKPGAVVINTAPMELVDIDALVERLKKDDITFILDHSDEMSEQDLGKLLPYANCIIYPPIAYVSKEAGISKQEMFTSNIENFVKGNPKNSVKIS
ncbi:MAG: 2-hydroxyacid dehydrogenase [Candidatus Levybacteria bacterium]|nr:2-hydroxyacid dehydrogenase [Candidatus Levybacteria bacterium]